MSEPPANQSDPLLERVNALLKRHQQTLRGPDDDVPVLTEVVESDQEQAAGDSGRSAASLDPAAVEEFVASMKREVLERLEPALDRLFAERLGPALAAAMGAMDEALSGARADLRAEAQRIVHDAVVSAVAQALDAPPRGRQG